jgi:hypothetical protein
MDMSTTTPKFSIERSNESLEPSPPLRQITTLTIPFISLTNLSASENSLTHLSPHLPPQSLSTLSLERNNFTCLSALSPLTALRNLQKLSLKSNKINAITDPTLPGKLGETELQFSESLSYVDISYNAIRDWPSIDALHDVFPGLTGLRVSHNPLYEEAGEVESDGKTNPVALGVEEGYMLTLARLKGLKSLNFSNVSNYISLFTTIPRLHVFIRLIPSTT